MKTFVRIIFKADTIAEVNDVYLGPAQCGPDVAQVDEYKYGGGKIGFNVEIHLDEGDERIAKICSLLTQRDEYHTVDRQDIYTEEDLQTAPLLELGGTWEYDNVVIAGPHNGTTYDVSSACKLCGMGARQTSGVIIRGEDERRIEKTRVAFTHHGDFLVHDVDGEKLVNEKFTGFNLWPIQSLRKDGTKVELRREQVLIENVMPPMAPSSLIDRREVCSVCKRGRFNVPTDDPLRIVYRREDLTNVQDFNLTWEGFGSSAKTPEEAFSGNWPIPSILVTPRVMNFFRGKTKKEQKHQGCSFTPIWIEGEEGQVSLETTVK
jgi:hypothetical protein